MLFPPNPVLISESVLKQLDASPPGQFYAQKKLDGRRRIVTRNMDGSYTWIAKSKSAEDTFALPMQLQSAFESIGWPVGTTLDCEYVHLRQKDGRPEIYIFDMLAYGGKWLSEPFKQRMSLLGELSMMIRTPSDDIHYVPAKSNPSMWAYYHSWQSDPLCEGVVIRAADQVNVGTRDKCKDGACIFKVKWA